MLMRVATFMCLCLFAAAAWATPYNDAVLYDKPIVYWTFDEASGNAISSVDPGINDQLLAQGGTTRMSHGAIASGLGLGNTAQFDGIAGTRFRSTDLRGPGTQFIPSQLWVTEMWVQVQGANVGNRSDYLLEGGAPGLGATNNPGLIYDFNHGAGDSNHIEMFSGGRTAGAGPVLTDTTKFHHLVFAFYGNSGGFGVANRREMYLDGQLFLDTTSGFSAGFALDDLSIGNAFGGEAPFEGRIDEVAVYDIGSYFNPIHVGADRVKEMSDRVKDISSRASFFDVTPLPGATYVYNPAGIQPHPAPDRADPALSKLTDGVTGGPAFNDGTWVGFQDPNGFNGDNGQPHPMVDFNLGGKVTLDALQIDYLVDVQFGIEAPDEVSVLLSDDGINYFLADRNFGFVNVDDNPTGGQGSVRSLTVLLGGQSAQYVRLDFRNNQEWTWLGEVRFFGTSAIPEPATMSLIGLAALAAIRRRRRA